MDVDRLLDELSRLRDKTGEMGPDHPRFRQWTLEVRAYLRQRGDGPGLERFDGIPSTRAAAEMWRRGAPTQAELHAFRADLEAIRALLEEASPAAQAFFRPARDPRGDPLVRQNAAPPAHGDAMDKTVAPSFDAVSRDVLAGSARSQAIDDLLAELKSEMKNSTADWARVQKVVGELMGLKKTGEILDRLQAEAAKPGAPWETVREQMRRLWATRRELLIESLPGLLGS